MEDARVIQQWGAFYLTRNALDIRTQSELWYIEAGLIIVKITATILAVIFDILTGILYIVFLIIKYLIIIVFCAIKEGTIFLFQKLISLLVYLLGLVLTIAVLYWIITHWDWFKNFINTLTFWING